MKNNQYDTNNDNYYSENNDVLKELAEDIIEEVTFFREGQPLPPLPSSIATDNDFIDIKINQIKK